MAERAEQLAHQHHLIMKLTITSFTSWTPALTKPSSITGCAFVTLIHVFLQFAKQFQQRGNKVIATVRQQGAGKQLQDALGGDVTIMQLDVSDPASVKAFAEEARAALDHIDVLINNAGAALTISTLLFVL